MYNGKKSVPQWELLELAFVGKLKVHTEASF